MLYVALGLSLMFILIAYLINEDNAKLYLSNYRSLSPEERQSFDLKGFLSVFRSFHLFLGLTIAVSSLIINRFGNDEMMVLVVGMYPLLAYAFLMYKTRAYNSEKERKRTPLYVSLMLAISIMVGCLSWYSSLGNDLVLEDNKLVITGMHGCEIPLSEIISFDLVDSIPSIKMRVNGSAIGSKKVGYFKTSTGDEVQLFIDKSLTDFIRIIAKDLPDVYFNSSNTRAVFEGINEDLN